MRGKIIELNLYDATKSKHGFIEGNDGKQYYFNQTSLLGKVTIDTFYTGDMVSFAVEKTSSTYDRAIHIKLEQHEEVYSKNRIFQTWYIFSAGLKESCRRTSKTEFW